MSLTLLFLATTPMVAGPAGNEARLDTLRIEVGSTLVNGKRYAPHTARVRVRVGDAASPLVAEWVNQLTLGDSAGRPIMRWVTKGTRFPPGGAPITTEIYQTYDAVTLAPYGYVLRSSLGARWQVTFEGPRVRGTRRMPGDSTDRQVDLLLDRAGFIASASDLLPLAVGLKRGAVILAPVWGPALANSELRVFAVLDIVAVEVEGTRIPAWKVEERRHADRQLLATWYLTEASPYMVYGEVVLPDGRIQRMTEVALPTRP